MGLFDGFKKRLAAKRHEDLTEEYELDYDVWAEETEQLETMLTIVRDCAAGRARDHFTDNSGYGYLLDPDEFAVAHVTGALYLENVKAPTRYTGGYGGVSFPIFGRVRVNTGRTGGRIIPGEESITPTDDGNALITNQRVMFVGAKRTHEWDFSKMVSVSHSPAGYTVFAMKGRGKPAGIAYGKEPATEVQFRLELASAMARGTLDRYVAELEAERVAHDVERPVPPPPPVSP